MNLDFQNASSAGAVPDASVFERWAAAVLQGDRGDAELTIRVVDAAEAAQLNRRYRGRNAATNVLSFPFEAPPGAPDTGLLGDLVICAPVVQREAREQGKAPEAHWAHMVIHGILHLLGYDHREDAGAAQMEDLETGLLAGLGYPPPYEEHTRE